MENFKFYAPTKVYFGKDEEKRVGKILKEFYPKKVLIHYGGQSAIKSGLLDRVKNCVLFMWWCSCQSITFKGK